MKFLILTYGCAANQSDSSIMKAKLLQANNVEAGNEEEADVIIVNSCGVKKPTGDKIINKIGRLIKAEKKVIVAGCLTAIEGERLKKFDLFGIVTPGSIDEIVEIAEKGGVGKEKKLNKARMDKCCGDVYIIQIAEGCLGACTYCGTRFARGSLRSYPVKDIIDEVKRASKFKTIYLTSQDDGAYGLDIGTNLASLLTKVANELKGSNTIVRVGMANPEHVKKQLTELIEAYKSDNIMKFIHLPIQSGSNRVLKEMNRRYTVEDVKVIMREFRKEIPKICISTDVIVGYPTETEEDFEETLEFLKEMKPNVLNMSKFFSRPNTPAEKLKPLPSETMKERSARLKVEFEKLKHAKRT